MSLCVWAGEGLRGQGDVGLRAPLKLGIKKGELTAR